MTSKKLDMSVAVALGVSLGAAAVFAEPENEVETSAKQTEQELSKDESSAREAFDPAELEDKVFLSSKGHRIKFWRDGKDQWRADVAEDFTGIEHEGLPVGFGDDWSVERLIGETSSKNRLHVLLRKELPEDFQDSGLVYVGNQGLLGGCQNCGEDDCDDDEKCKYEGLQPGSQQKMMKLFMEKMKQEIRPMKKNIEQLESEVKKQKDLANNFKLQLIQQMKTTENMRIKHMNEKTEMNSSIKSLTERIESIKTTKNKEIEDIKNSSAKKQCALGIVAGLAVGGSFGGPVGAVIGGVAVGLIGYNI